MKFLIKPFQIFFILLIFTSFFSCQKADKKSKIKKDTQKILISGNTFDEVFTKYAEFIVDTAIKVGEIRHLEVDNEGSILITDVIGRNVFLLDNNGELKKILSPEDCSPGFHWNPVFAQFVNNKIYVINAGPWGYRFDNAGNCLGGMDKTFISPRYLTGFEDNKILGYFTVYNDLTLKVMDPDGKDEFDFGKFPVGYKNMITRIECGGIVVDSDYNIYQMNVSSPKIYKFNKKGEIIKTIPNYSKKFKKLDKDFSNNPLEIMNDVKRLKNASLAGSLFLLNRSILIVKIIYPDSYGLLLIDLNGNLLNKDELEIAKNNVKHNDLLYAKNNKLYFVEDKLTSDGKFINPKILVYKLNTN